MKGTVSRRILRLVKDSGFRTFPAEFGESKARRGLFVGRKIKIICSQTSSETVDMSKGFLAVWLDLLRSTTDMLCMAIQQQVPFGRTMSRFSKVGRQKT